MSLRGYLVGVVGVLLLGVAMVFGAVLLRDHLDDQPRSVEALVATEPVDACASQADWANTLDLVRLTTSDMPEGALADLSVVSTLVPKRPIPAGTVIRVQLFTKAKDCKTDTG